MAGSISQKNGFAVKKIRQKVCPKKIKSLPKKNFATFFSIIRDAMKASQPSGELGYGMVSAGIFMHVEKEQIRSMLNSKFEVDSIMATLRYALAVSTEVSTEVSQEVSLEVSPDRNEISYQVVDRCVDALGTRTNLPKAVLAHALPELLHVAIQKKKQREFLLLAKLMSDAEFCADSIVEQALSLRNAELYQYVMLRLDKRYKAQPTPVQTYASQPTPVIQPTPVQLTQPGDESSSRDRECSTRPKPQQTTPEDKNDESSDPEESTDRPSVRRVTVVEFHSLHKVSQFHSFFTVFHSETFVRDFMRKKKKNFFSFFWIFFFAKKRILGILTLPPNSSLRT
jgi:hypothetical protein